ncbi:MAG: saccharopine dehydrogenase, partial [Gemmatimonadota bacterium]
IGKLPDGSIVRARVTGDRDPGYGSTSKMIAESAVCLAKNDLPVKGGFWTPASAMGDALLKRLVDNAGLTFDLL